MAKTNINYTPLNLIAFNFGGFACIAIVVFLASTQPFYISEVIGITADDKIGSIIGTLGFTDELVSIASSAFVGTLTDKLNNLGFRGSRLIQSSGFLVISLSLFGYGVLSKNIYPDLLFFRSIFALGVTSCMSMVTVMLNELSNSDFHFKKFIFWKQLPNLIELDDVLETGNRNEDKKNGKYAALIGISTGLGAIFSVSFFLSLPIKLMNRNTDWTLKDGLKASYLIVAVFAIIAFAFLFTFLYNGNKKVTEEAEGEVLLGSNVEDSEEKLPYLSLLYKGIQISKVNQRVQLSYIGAFVARSTTVTTAVFIPLLVYNYYYKHGECKSIDYPNKKNCSDGFIFSAILTGVAQTIALISSPLWGYLIDTERVGKFRTLMIAALIGVLGNYGICLIGTTRNGVYDPHTVACFVMVSLIGLSQIGIIITSMSVLSGLSHNTSHMGSLSGLYSLSGGIGILIITKVGGIWSDYWILGPFFLLGTFNVVLLAASISYFQAEKHQIELSADSED
ncbi:major facilitator superfamily domain-containing protein [Scheffersomyces xylosifermentans]|uniref:major facilitator superfamily domain-containing protein n=1 Tax=Scheffersomyces xylosifermentans TaxID=1304137 RepID=UPI00315D42D1